MNKIAISLVLVTLLTGCGVWDKTVAEVKGYSKICVEGVTYLQFSSGAAVQVDIHGNVVACQ